MTRSRAVFSNYRLSPINESWSQYGGSVFNWPFKIQAPYKSHLEKLKLKKRAQHLSYRDSDLLGLMQDSEISFLLENVR